jgi:hypothetical protein
MLHFEVEFAQLFCSGNVYKPSQAFVAGKACIHCRKAFLKIEKQTKLKPPVEALE